MCLCNVMQCVRPSSQANAPSDAGTSPAAATSPADLVDPVEPTPGAAASSRKQVKDTSKWTHRFPWLILVPKKLQSDDQRVQVSMHACNALPLLLLTLPAPPCPSLNSVPSVWRGRRRVPIHQRRGLLLSMRTISGCISKAKDIRMPSVSALA